jgi:hypothetical protein
MALSGNIRDFSVADIFSLLSQQQKTGSLSLTCGRSKAKLVFSRGKILSVMVAGRTPLSVVRDVLIQRGRVRSDIYEELAVAAKSTQTNLFKLLVKKGYLDDSELNSWYQIAAEDLVIELLTWSKGEYRFDAENIMPKAEDRCYDLSTDFIILEGMRQIDEHSQNIRMLPHGNPVFKITKPDFEEYELGPDRFVMQVIDGKKKLNDLQNELPFGQFRLFASLVELQKEGFIIPFKKGEQADEKLPTRKERYRLVLHLWPLAAALVLLSGGLYIRRIMAPVLAAEVVPVEEIRNSLKKRNIDIAIMDYTLKSGRPPEDLKALVEQQYVTRSEFRYSRRKLFGCQVIDPMK